MSRWIALLVAIADPMMVGAIALYRRGTVLDLSPRKARSAARRRGLAIPSALATLLLLVPADAGVAHHESTDGDLSSDPSAPTRLALRRGGNIITGHVAAPDDARDYITFAVPDGAALIAIRLLQYQDSSTGDRGNTGFHGLHHGDRSFIPSRRDADRYLGADDLSSDAIGQDLLETLSAAPRAGVGFVAPLGPGTYTYVIQQSGTQPTAYSLELVLADASPEPPSDVTTVAPQPRPAVEEDSECGCDGEGAGDGEDASTGAGVDNDQRRKSAGSVTGA